MSTTIEKKKTLLKHPDKARWLSSKLINVPPYNFLVKYQIEHNDIFYLLQEDGLFRRNPATIKPYTPVLPQRPELTKKGRKRLKAFYLKVKRFAKKQGVSYCRKQQVKRLVDEVLRYQGDRPYSFRGGHLSIFSGNASKRPVKMVGFILKEAEYIFADPNPEIKLHAFTEIPV